MMQISMNRLELNYFEICKHKEAEGSDLLSFLLRMNGHPMRLELIRVDVAV